METAVDGAVPAPKGTVHFSWTSNPACQAAALSVAYAALYVGLDRLTFIGALHGVNITPWSPSAGLAVVLLLIKGLRYAPLVMVAELASNVTLIVTPVPPIALCAGSFVVMVVYSGAAAILRQNGLHAGIQGSAHVATLLIVAIISSGLGAAGFVTAYATAGVVPWRGFADAAVHYWVGDAIGIVVFLPPLLLLYERTQQSGASALSWFALQKPLEVAAEAAGILIALVVVFSGLGGDHPLSLFYLLFPPLIWIAARHGLPAAGWAILAIQIGLIVGFEAQDHSNLTLRSLQLLMFTLAATGLMLGAVVSERQRLSLALEDGEQLRRAILNTVPDGLLTIDERGRIQLVNPAVERLFACSRKLVIGKCLSELVEGASDLRDRLKLPMQASAAPAELNGRRSDGSMFPVEFSASRFDLHGMEHYAVVIRDISSRREAEDRRRRHEAELAHISRVSLAGEMATGLAHELSQPLTAITAYARGCLRLLCGSATGSSLLHEGMEQVVRQAERAGDILGRLREFVRGGEYRPTPTAVRSLIDSSICLARADANQRDIQIEARVEPGLPLVLADRIQIEQVLLNLLRNAMEATEGANTFRRRVVVEAKRKSRHAVEITVADSGPGVLDEMRDNIFDPFVTTKPLGMGMGLSISRSIIESHGGSLRMAPNIPCGATFFFDLPTPEAQATIDAGQDRLCHR